MVLARFGVWRAVALLVLSVLPAITLAATTGTAAESMRPVVVFAAASLKNALDEVADTWKSETGKTAAISYAGSAQLAKQIQQGAPADIFVSANIQWMTALADANLIRKDTARDLLRNRIVLIAHGRNAKAVEIGEGFDLAGRLADGKLAMAMVDSVPAGIYGKAALTSLGIWGAVAPKVAQTDNVRAALTLVARGEAPYGIVYATDAAATDAVTVVATFPERSHPPIVYPAAITAESDNSDAGNFLAYLSSPAARGSFERQGFAVLQTSPTN
ncbi:MAG: molybdate ABC transporter substrate-binding protein [Hyphomicrobiaceae bacterium]|nr:molybdate ABC transporter substrate-binding protein [Hyphomicrobiaceae bacterium]